MALTASEKALLIVPYAGVAGRGTPAPLRSCWANTRSGPLAPYKGDCAIADLRAGSAPLMFVKRRISCVDIKYARNLQAPCGLGQVLVMPQLQEPMPVFMPCPKSGKGRSMRSLASALW